jgi:signal transduction histidine kinase
MKVIDWPWVKGLSRLLTTRRLEPTQQARRIVAIQLNIVLPVKAGLAAVVFYYLFHTVLPYEVTNARGVANETLQRYFLIYVACNAVAAVILVLWRRFPPWIFQWLLFVMGLLDGLSMAGLTFITGGFESTAYWMFPGLIVLNAISIPLATPQIVLNLLLSAFYLSAGFLDAEIPNQLTLEAVPRRNPTRLVAGTNVPASMTNLSGPPHNTAPAPLPRAHKPIHWDSYEPVLPEEEIAAEPFVLRLCVLLLLTACCYGLQVLAERQRRVLEEEREFAVREAQLRSAGRLAAEFAHQIKNPLAIINNAVFSMQRALKAGRNDIGRQIQIIQEEVERSDRIVTQIMGYAQLSEGHVERLNLIEEVDRAVGLVFPPAAGFGVHVERQYESDFPPLLMQRRHFSEALVNLLQNAREAVGDRGTVTVAALCRPDDTIEIRISDTGPGIPADSLERIFEAYYTTKERGTGLGLAIVKHNVELYAGTVRAESELGKGSRFVLLLPARAAVSLERHDAPPRE